MGFFDGLDAEKYDRTYSDSELFRRIVGYFKPQWKRLIGVSLFTLAIAGAGSLLPIMVSRGVGLLAGKPTILSLVTVGVAVFVIGLVMWFSNLASRRLITRAIAEVVSRLALDTYEAAVQHDLSFFDEFSSAR
jgi:ATP-binding cassette subfamily B protein